MTIETVDSIETWIVRAIHGRRSDVSYRGLNDSSFSVSSSLDRVLQSLPGPPRDRNEAEGYMLDSFLRTAKGMLEPMPDEAYPLLARHYGLETLLMDWTHSLGVATFFAYAPFNDHDRAVVEFAPGSMLNLGYVVVIDDGLGLTKRLVAQSAYFFKLLRHTTLEDAFADFEAECAAKSRPMDASLTKFILPRKDRALALRFLRTFNVGYDTLFPDLIGAAQMANLLRNDPDFA